jgi:hypothetical protein
VSAQVGAAAQNVLLPRFPCRLVWSPRKVWTVTTKLSESQLVELFTQRMTRKANIIRQANDYFRRARWDVQRNAISGELIAACRPTGPVTVGFGKNKWYLDVSNDTVICSISRPTPEGPSEATIGVGRYTTLFGLYAYPATVYSFDIVKAIKRADRSATIKYPWSPARMVALAAVSILLLIAATSGGNNSSQASANIPPAGASTSAAEEQPGTSSAEGDKTEGSGESNSSSSAGESQDESSNSDGSTTTSESPDGTSPNTGTTGSPDAATQANAVSLEPYSGPGFRAQIPAGWVQVEDGAHRPGYRESKWQNGSDNVLIDASPATSRSLSEDAAPVHRDLEREHGYVEISYGPGGLSSNESWEWVFRLDSDQRVDYFFNSCNLGFAVLGSSSVSRFAQLGATFKAVAESVRGSCE